MQKVKTPKRAVTERGQDERTASTWRHCADVDQAELDYDIKDAKALYEFHVEHKSGRAWRDHCDAVKQVRKAAKLLKKGLAVESVQEALSLNFVSWNPDPVISWAEKELAPRALSPLDREMEPYVKDAVGLGRVSAVEFIVGEHLPRVFTKHFRQPVSTTPDGAYVRFALDVLAEWSVTRPNGQPHAPESVVKALMLARGSGTRRMRKAD
jgi:hypothetical protein